MAVGIILETRSLTSQGTHLSGGEQQMLAMARILRTGARLLLLDEITEGWVTVITGGIFVVCVLTFRRGVIGELGNLIKRPL